MGDEGLYMCLIIAAVPLSLPELLPSVCFVQVWDHCGWVGQKFLVGCNIVCSAIDEFDSCSQETESAVTILTYEPECFRRESFNLIVIPCSITQTFPHVLSL
jgi:hypothetical protein